MKKIVALLSLTLFANFSHAQLNGFKKVPNVDPNVMYTFKTNPTADVLYRINISKFDNELFRKWLINEVLMQCYMFSKITIRISRNL